MRSKIISIILLLTILVCAGEGALAQSRSVRYLGVYLGDINEGRAQKMKLSDRRGAIVGKVEQLSPAAKAGIREKDIIVSLNSRAIHSRAEFYTSLVELGTDIYGIKAVVGVLRNGELLEINVELGLRKIPGTTQQKQNKEKERILDMQSMSDKSVLKTEDKAYKETPDIGITVLPLTSQLATFLNTSKGVLVGEVKAGGLADKAGIKAGDSIIAINDKVVVAPPEFYKIIKQSNNDGVDGSSRNENVFTIIRDGVESKIIVK